MARSKRKPPSLPLSAPSQKLAVATKKHRENEVSSAIFDHSCDNILLRILSYTDLRALIRLTRCTSASLRRRFNPKNASGSGGALWPAVFGDLLMAPLDDGPRGHLDAIGHRVSLRRTLEARDRRARAAGGLAARRRCYSLPLRHHWFRPMDDAWSLEGLEEDVDGDMVRSPFALLSGGSMGGFVCVNPLSCGVEVHGSVLDGAICLDKSAQRAAAAAAPNRRCAFASRTLKDTITDGHPTRSRSRRQVLIDHYYKLPQGDHYVDEKWEDYFGKKSPFADRLHGAHNGKDSNNVIVCGLMLFTFEVTNKDWSLNSRKIGMLRVVKDKRHQDHVCSEFVFWGDDGCASGSHPKYSLEGVCRLPLQWHIADVHPAGGCLFALFDTNNGPLMETFYPGAGNGSRAVFRITPSSRDSESFYSTPDYFLLAEHDVSCLESFAHNLLLVGTVQGTIELWEAGCDAPRRLCVYRGAVDTILSTSGVSSEVVGFYHVDSRSLRQGFLTKHGDSKEVIVLWQPPRLDLQTGFEIRSADFRIMAVIQYDCIFPQVISVGGRLAVLIYDKFGSLYLDIYQIFGSMYALPDTDTASIPKDVDITHLHPCGEERIQFVNRINMRHRVPVEYNEEYSAVVADKVHIDMNERFVTIIANDGLVGNDGAKRSGPGILVIDLDKDKKSLI